MSESILELAALDEYNERRAYEKINHTPEQRTFYKPKCSTRVVADTLGPAKKFNGHSSMGLAPGSYKPSTSSWVKKNQFHPDMPDPKEFHYESPLARKPPVPNQHVDQPVCGLKSNVDFVKQNIKKAQLMIPKARPDKEVDWTTKEDFGKTPAYLEKMKEQIKQEQQQLQEFEQSKGRQREKAFKLDAAERDELLQGLKKNWTELHSEYVGATKAVVDTNSQKERKQWLEKRMAEIEADIILLEKGDIFVK